MPTVHALKDSRHQLSVAAISAVVRPPAAAPLRKAGLNGTQHCYIICGSVEQLMPLMQISKRLLLSRPCNRWQRWHAAGRRRRTLKPALLAPSKELELGGMFIGFTAHADRSRFKGLAASAVSRRRQRRHPTARRSAAPQSRPQWNPATATFGCGSVVQLMPLMQISKRLLSLRPCNRWQRWHAAGRRC